jgi:RNA-directed DNA polymerase
LGANTDTLKRYGYLFEKIVDIENLKLAHKNASKGKSYYKEVIWVNNNEEIALKLLQKRLINGSFKTSEYTFKKITERNKERVIAKLPYYPDRIVHHAILQIVEPILKKSLIRDTFQSIKNRGTHDCRRRISKFIDKNSPTHYMKIDLKKYYPNIQHEFLKNELRKKIKDKKVLSLLNEIIDSYLDKGLPIGSYTSQILGNFNLSWLDWKIKKKIKGYFRYCDDMLFLGNKKELEEIKQILLKLNLEIKYHPIVSKFNRFVFIGYKYLKNKILLKKNIIRNTYKSTSKNIFSFWGWFKPIRNKNLWKDTYIRLNGEIV